MKLLILLFFSLFSGAEPSAGKIDSLISFCKISNNNSEYAVLIDMSIPSDEKRLFLVQLGNRKIVYSTFVAHGKGSGHDARATVFSDVPGSLCTALGKYKVGKNYIGKHGNSYELIGLEKTNANAVDRAIVIHSAWYVEEDFIKKNNRCGNSWGCPAVSPEALEKLKPYLIENTVVWIYK
jgi:hypothetical protein